MFFRSRVWQVLRYLRDGPLVKMDMETNVISQQVQKKVASTTKATSRSTITDATNCDFVWTHYHFDMQSMIWDIMIGSK